jgi:uncharacterized tellurite resistance protein B-like protein
MFLQHLSEKEKKAFLTLAKEFILVDGVLSQEEEALVTVMKAEMGIEEGFKDGEKNREELFGMFESRKTRIAAIIEMQGLGYANMEYHTEEQAFINQMANTFKISKEELSKIDDWVIRQVALLYEANEFWAEENEYSMAAGQ